MSDFHHDNVLPPRFCGGVVNWRTRLVHWAGKCAGLLVKVEGFPYGTSRNRKEIKHGESGTAGLFVGNAAKASGAGDEAARRALGLSSP